ncbi:MAG: pseudaminic acid biosynthesis-associated methylase [Candidatus Omnitrophota bacterium]
MKGKLTNQLKTWSGDFGKKYTDRNIYDPKALDIFYKKTWGIPRSKMNKACLSAVQGNIKRTLEVGSNVGNQLACLQSMGFENLYGIEIQDYAVEKSKELTSGINIIKGSAFDIPFKDGYFDMVFTSGVLIHIAPGDVGAVLDEIYRCSKRYIWGFEYYADKYTEVEYRGNHKLLWKTDFCSLFLDRFSDLKLKNEKKYGYLETDNIDSMFLLEKKKG